MKMKVILNASLAPLDSIHSFQSSSTITMLPPLHEDVFCAEFLKDLEEFYKIIYPQCTFEYVSPFFVRCGRVTLCKQLIGSVMNSRSAKSSSVISAYWPTTMREVQTPIDYSARIRVGTVQHFCQHKIVLCTADNDKLNCEHILAYVKWNRRHAHEDWYGVSATVCESMCEADSPCSFIPVQRIHAICAHCLLNTKIHTIYENVFIAIPIPTKFSI